MSGARTATAIAHPNIALAKYWGKREGDGNVPAVPSLSVTLAGMSTTTTVAFDATLVDDELVLNGVAQAASARTKLRATQMLDCVRAAAVPQLRSSRARIVSTNDFPTASGLASSASGFAALALASVRAAGLDWSAERVADLARRSSASAARSLFGGFVELDGGPASDGAARAVAGPSALDLRVIVCVTTEAEKATSSTDGMGTTQAKSPYYAAWVADAPNSPHARGAPRRRLHARRRAGRAQRPRDARMRDGSGDRVRHRCDARRARRGPRDARRRTLSTYATIDAGPHLKCLVRASDASAALARLERVPGVLRLIEATPGEGARLVTANEGTS